MRLVYEKKSKCNIMKFGLDQWSKCTPKKIKKIGSAISAFLASIATFAIIEQKPYWSFGIMAAAGLIREVIVPLFGEEEEEEEDVNTKENESK